MKKNSVYGGEVLLFNSSYTPTKVKSIYSTSPGKGYLVFEKPLMWNLDDVIDIYGSSISSNDGRYVISENTKMPLNGNTIGVSKISGNILDEVVSAGYLKNVLFPWKIKILPYLIILPNDRVIYKNFSSVVDLGKYAVDIADSFRKVIIYIDVSTNEIGVFGDIITRVDRNITKTYVLYENAYVQVNPNTTQNPIVNYDYLDVEKYPSIKEKDIVVIADVFISNKQSGIQSDNIDMKRRGFFVPSSTSIVDKSGVARDNISKNIRYWNYLLPDGLRDLRDEYQVLIKNSSVPKRIASLSRVGMMSYMEFSGSKYIGINGPHHCSAADTLCSNRDSFCDVSTDVCAIAPSCSPGCDTTDTVCNSDDWSILRLNDGCDDSCEVACQAGCQSAIQTTSCAVNCECGHEHTTYNPEAECAGCEIACQAVDARSDHRCYWYVETPGSEDFVQCQDCDSYSDPHNLASCNSCDVEADTKCGIGSDAYCYETCPVSTDIEIPWCKTQCEGTPGCPTEYQNPCGACEQNEWGICNMGGGKRKGCIAPKTLQFDHYDDIGVDKKSGDHYVRTRKYSFYIDGKYDYVVSTKLISTENIVGDGGVVINDKWILNVNSMIPCVLQGDTITLTGTSFDGDYRVDGFDRSKNQYYVTSANIILETPANATMSIENNCVPTNEYNLRLWTSNLGETHVKSLKVGMPGTDVSYSYNKDASYTDYYFKVDDIAPINHRLITVTIEWNAYSIGIEANSLNLERYRAFGAFTINLLPVCDPAKFISADYNEDMIFIKNNGGGGSGVCHLWDSGGKREVPRL